METMERLVNEQRNLFLRNETRSYAFRKEQLKKLKRMLKSREAAIYQALKTDLNKSKHEALTTELGILYSEIDVALKNVKSWMEPEKVDAPVTHKGTKNYIMSEPYGVTVIISPWNYPVHLALAPAIGAIAAGNTVILKPSEFTENTSALLTDMISKTFDRDYFAVVEGDKDVSEQLVKQAVDYIFFTGSSNVGKIIMREASDNLTPVTLELGGKSPVIVNQDADINLAAKRIVWGKFTNAGQTCVAPDYLYVHENIKPKLLKAIQKHIKSFYGKKPLRNNDYVHIVNKRHFTRLQAFLSNGKVVHGGNSDPSVNAIEPTILDHVTWEDPVMQEEIFGPILPILTFTDLETVINKLQQMGKPLALYYFGENEADQQNVLQQVSFGGGCINDTLYHLANPHLPFGGVGTSGMGGYHGKYSFDTFSHKKSIMKQTTKFDMPFRYPGSKFAHAVVKRIMK
ncbi:aldehyde dehydrogenase [Lentibacillus sp. N15]|uniref:aldehyde dehydrogenase n=1 Tax=Lentibacillus songyuanensis TaxID=3136161 RepID=UPI0031BBAB7C